MLRCFVPCVFVTRQDSRWGNIEEHMSHSSIINKNQTLPNNVNVPIKLHILVGVT
jgi:hypothetical protein